MFKKIIISLKTNHFWRNLFKNSFWAFIGESSASAIELIITYILIKAIGSDNYGILILGQSYMSIMDVLINVQSWKSVIQYGQKCLVENSKIALHSYVKLGSILDMSTAILCTLMAFFLVSFVGKIFGWSSELVMCARLFSLTIFSHFAGTPTAILRIFDKFHLVALQKFLGATIKLSALFVPYLKEGKLSLYSVVIAYCLADIANNLMLVLFALLVYRKKVGLKGVLKAKSPKHKKEFIWFTLWGTVSEIVDLPVNYFDVFIVSTLGNSAVSIFKVFKQCVGIIQKVISPIKQSIMPQFSELTAQKNEKRGFEVVEKIHRVVICIGMPLSALVGLLSPFWLKALYGEEYASQWYILLLYLIIQTYALSYSVIHPYFLALNQPKRSALYVLVANIIYAIIALITAKYIGLLGMVVAFLIQSYLVVKLKKNYIKKMLRKRD